METLINMEKLFIKNNNLLIKYEEELNSIIYECAISHSYATEPYICYCGCGSLFDKSSMNYLNIQLTEALSYLLKPYCKNFVFNVADIWINRYETNDYQGSHIHPGDFSFIIYYKINKSYTVFNSPVKNILESSDNKFFNRDCEPNTKEGDMIVFPSYLEHWVKPNSNNITVSGNIKIIELIK